MLSPDLKTPNLLGDLLIARPQSQDPHFHHSVVVVCSHSDQGAWGLCLNRPLRDPLRCSQVWQCLGWPLGEEPQDQELWLGGPVLEDRVFVVHTQDWRGPATQDLADVGVSITQDPSIFHALHEGQHVPRRYKIFLGFSSWSAGQLEGEYLGLPPWSPDNAWLTAPSRRDIILSRLSTQRQWRRAIAWHARHRVDQWFHSP